MTILFFNVTTNPTALQRPILSFQFEYDISARLCLFSTFTFQSEDDVINNG